MTLTDKAMIGAGLGLLAALAWVAMKGAKNAGAQIGGAAVDMANGIVTGAVVGAGQVVGIPATSQTQCEKDKAAGNTWEASFSCPAADFLKYWWNK